MLSTFPSLLPFLLFAFVASITPGPTNILVLSNSARYGFRAALPIVFGACASAAFIVLLVGSGFGETLNHFPALQRAMQWVGVLWLSYLGYTLFRAPVDVIDPLTPGRALGMWGAAGLQWINPKTWVMALAGISVFASNGPDQSEQIRCLSALFFLVAVPCLTAWAVLGAASSKLLRSTVALARFNRCMALFLLCLAWWPVLR